MHLLYLASPEEMFNADLESSEKSVYILGRDEYHFQIKVFEECFLGGVLYYVTCQF